MAIFRIEEFMHFGIDVGITALEVVVALDEDFEKILNVEVKEGYNVVELISNMKIQRATDDDIYWNGHSVIYVKVRFFMNNNPKQWIYTSWEPNQLNFFGEHIEPTNPLTYEQIMANDFSDYIKHSPLALKPYVA